MKHKTVTFKFKLIIIILLLALLLSVVLALGFGAVKINPVHTYYILLERIFGFTAEIQATQSEYNIIWQIRLPRVLLGVFVGAGLSLCGTVMQATVQNPLAEPYILGISAGATLGATFSIIIGIGTANMFWAFVGSVGATFAVLTLASYGSKMTSSKLVLSGTVINALFSAVSNFIISIAGDSTGIMTIKFWTLGSLTRANWDNIWPAIVIVLICSLFFLTQYRTLNTMLLGEEAAVSLGINLNFYRKLYMLICSLLTGVLVAACGIIGFVGLIIPHILRALTGPDHRKVMPAALLMGAIFMLWADVFARSAVPNAELPIGIITALVGAPFFVYILVKKSYGFGGH